MLITNQVVDIFEIFVVLRISIAQDVFGVELVGEEEEQGALDAVNVLELTLLVPVLVEERVVFLEALG